MFIYHPYGRKWRGTKKPLDESESGEWKSWLKVQHSENEDHGIFTSREIDGETVSDFIFGGSKITVDGDCSHEIKRHLLLGKKLWQHIKNQRHYFANKDPSSQGYGFSSSHVWMWELDYKESWGQVLMLLNCGAGEDFWESLGLQGDATSPS